MKRFEGALAALLALTLASAVQAADGGAPGSREGSITDSAVADLTRPTSEIDLGIGNVSRDSPKAGEYNGLHRKGPFGIGNLGLRGGGDYDSGDATRWRIDGTNLGLDSRSLGAEYGVQGTYRVRFGYDQLRQFTSNTYQTAFVNAGSAAMTLPAGWVASTTTAGMTALNAGLRPFTTDTTRRKYDFRVSVVPAEQWEGSVSFRRETKDGTQLQGLQGPSASFGLRGLLAPIPISYTTDQFDAGLERAGKLGHVLFAYHGSLFRNGNNAFTWQSPYDPGTPTQRMSEAPDNQFHQLSLTGGYSFSSTTRATAHAAYGRMTQNEGFLAYNFAGVGIASGTLLPRSSLEGDVRTTALNLKLTSRPFSDLGLLASFKYDGRANRTPRSVYQYVETDNSNVQPALGAAVAVKAPPSGLADQVRTNVPHDRTLAQWNLEADYTLTTGIAIKGGLQRQEIKRTLLETNRTAENAYKLELRSNILEDVTGLIGYTNSTRRNTNYDANAWWLATYNNTLTPGAPGAYAATGAGASPPYFGANLLGVPNPAEAKFFLANRNRGQWRALLNAAPTEALTLGAGLDYNRDDYQNSVYGLTASNSWAINLDASYQVNANVTLSAYYSHENIWSSQAGNAGNAALPETVGGYTGPQYLNPLRQWDATIRDKVNTLGMSLRQKGLHGGRIELAGDLVLTQSATGYAFGGGNVYATPAPPAAIATEAVPDATSRYLSLVLDGKYALGRNSSVRLTYVYRRLVSSDYQWDSLVGVTLPSMVATNETSPHYAVSVLGVTYVHRFQ